jgi:hypothetical protein
MEDPVANAILTQYFRRLEQALEGLPAERRAQVLEDLRAHVDDCLAAEPDHSEASILAILDRVGDPDEIAREAHADAAHADAAHADTAHATLTRSDANADAADPATEAPARGRWWMTAPAAALVVAIAILVISLSSSRAPADPPKASGPTVHGVLVATHRTITAPASAWLPASDVSGDHQSLGGSDCSPQTRSGSESASALESGASKVASGTVGGNSWSLWSRNGQKGANGLETGGVVVDGVAHGLCPGFPNPGEMELLEPSGGGDGIAYGVVGYAGPAKVAIYSDTFGGFATTKLIATTAAQKVNGVGFFITQVSESACDVAGVEMNTASSNYATEHNLAFADSDCSNGQLVPITDSQGIWQLPTSGFPDKFQSGGRGAAAPVTKSGWLPSSDIMGDHGSPGASDCSPQTTSGSESASALEAGATQVASGSVSGHSWSLWSKKGQSGANGLETGGVVVDGVGYGLCPGFPNPGEMELLEPHGGGNGIAYGVVGYPGAAKVAIYSDTFGNFAATKLIAMTGAQKVNGVGFFITQVSESACDVAGVEMNTASSSAATEHNLAFADGHCKDGQLVPISDSQGIWDLSPSGFPDKLGGSGNAGGGAAATPATKDGWIPSSDISGGGGIDDSSCGPQTASGSESTSALEASATKVASGTTAGQSWSLWSKKGGSGATGLEDGGIVVGGIAHGLCPGFPNPSETELLEPSSGGDGLAYGVVGYTGSAKVSIYADTFGNFAATKLIATATAQKVNGVGFYITPLSESACDVAGIEVNSASSNYAAEHNLAFSDNYCKDGQLVPISDSQGIWQLPVKDYPDKFQSLNGGGGSVSTPTLGNASDLPNSHRIAASLRAHFAIFATHRVASSQIPLPVVRMLSHMSGRLGLDISDIAEVSPTSGVRMWLIGGTSGECGLELDRSGGGGSCGLIHDGLGPGTMGAGRNDVTAEGFAPDGVKHVIVYLLGGTKVTVPVKDNAYYFVRAHAGRVTAVKASRS